MRDCIFIIGNGPSRQHYHLSSLHKYGTTIGCNALYRDFEPDYLVAIDQRMIEEIVKSGYDKNVWFLDHFGKFDKQPFNKIHRNTFETQLSGTTAINLAFHLFKDIDKICLLGFDDLWDRKDYTNIYKDTKNYDLNHKPIPPIKSVQYLVKAITTHPIVNFYRVGNDHYTVHPKLTGFSNFSFITYTDMGILIG